MSGFSSIFWGFLFMFDFRIQVWDILPNFIGYIFMYYGLGNLSLYSSQFGNAKKYSIPLAVLSLFSLYQVQNSVGRVNFDFLSLGAVALGIITTVLDLLLVYHLCLGIIDLAKDQSNDDLQELAHHRWKYYFFYKVVFIIWFTIGLAAPFLLAIGFIPMFIFSIAVLLLMMALMKKSQESLSINRF
ncbi:hypothetical protein REC12_11960 [Desulfosporosinus sp. PR]|uniref:hypothetical protein n=1 Tax=Candidatus Desulfosporosinus nitrosoreducens TaxID=3401928 RepID=UPI0027F9785D|nr:hypothetical protein [Desulfosporosinus sp. PR]MDQ7094305.1 hypothetical protein [Desulfosporosinus sp. PR]